MQIYTKVLIGMGVGVVLGITVGPKSSFLEHDTYTIADASQVDVRLNRDNEASQLAFPEGARLRLTIKEVIREDLEDSVGQTHNVPVWSKVYFEYTRDLALRDSEGALAEQLGGASAGKIVTAWLRLSNIPLPSGGFSTTPIPISGIGDTIMAWLKPVGDAFMSLIKMVIVPLVFSSLLVGVASLGDVRKLGRLGIKTLGLYICTTGIAVTIGLVLASIIRPGDFLAEADSAALKAQYAGDAEGSTEAAAEAPTLVDNVLGIIPDNPVESLASGNMLQIIFFALIFAVALTLLDDKKGTPIVVFFDRVQHAMIMIIHMVMAIAPFGVLALVANVVGQSGISVLLSLAVYAGTVLLGLAIHAVLVYGGLVRVIGKLPVWSFMKAIRPAQLIAFSTSSSSAALPVSMEVAEENLGISQPVASFVLPLGSTVNMDGTALYQGVAAVFIAQVFDVDLSLGAQIGIVATATMASIGAAGVPGAGIVTLAMVLTAAGIPPVGVALILGMDRLLDMFRTAVNVTGDLAVTAVMATSEGEKLSLLSSEQDKADPHRGFEGRLDHEEQAVPPED